MNQVNYSILQKLVRIKQSELKKKVFYRAHDSHGHESSGINKGHINIVKTENSDKTQES